MTDADTSIDFIPATLANTLPGLLAERGRRSPQKTACLQFAVEREFRGETAALHAGIGTTRQPTNENG